MRDGLHLGEMNVAAISSSRLIVVQTFSIIQVQCQQLEIAKAGKQGQGGGTTWSPGEAHGPDRFCLGEVLRCGSLGCQLTAS